MTLHQTSGLPQAGIIFGVYPRIALRKNQETHGFGGVIWRLSRHPEPSQTTPRKSLANKPHAPLVAAAFLVSDKQPQNIADGDRNPRLSSGTLGLRDDLC